MSVPTARYMLALKLKALRIAQFEKGQQDMADVAHLLKALHLTFASPAEFASRNIFTEERPLRRARGPRPPQ